MLLNVEEGRAPKARCRREPIPREVRRAVFERDGGKCAQCGSNFDLQYDHVIPVVLGGATTVGNLQLLCGDCNREKGADL
jgi:5-methylcytosine-specific restriction endonuclease McrA